MVRVKKGMSSNPLSVPDLTKAGLIKIGLILKFHKEKVISKASLTNMSKRGKSAYSRHIFAFANNFFGTFF